MASIFELVADPTRRQILDLLRERERSVGELVEATGLSQPGVSKHLRLLREGGLVQDRQEGQRRVYQLRAQPLQELEGWLEPFRKAWASRLDSLEEYLERERDRMQGTARQVAEGYEVRFERHLKHPVEQVWRAITEPEAMIAWLAESKVELRLGGEVSLRWLNVREGDPEILARGTVTAFEPLHLVEYSTDIHGRMRWELEREGEGTLLIFTCTIALPPEHLLKHLAGWHSHLEHLADALNGATVDWPHWWTVHYPRWQELHERYARAAK